MSEAGFGVKIADFYFVYNHGYRMPVLTQTHYTYRSSRSELYRGGCYECPVDSFLDLSTVKYHMKKLLLISIFPASLSVTVMMV